MIALAAESKTPAHFNLQLARAALKSGKGVRDSLCCALRVIVLCVYAIFSSYLWYMFVCSVGLSRFAPSCVMYMHH